MEDAAAVRVGQQYSERQGQSTAERQQSEINKLRELNNWVKRVLIRQFARRGDWVLDLACGKGGDLPKWRETGVEYYCGIDIATESVRKDARERYNQLRPAFPAALFVADCFEAPLEAALGGAAFDLVSCQFALHYAFSSERRARRALQNVAAALRPGGLFLGTTADADVLVKKLRAQAGLRLANRVYSCDFEPRFAAKTFSGRDGPFGLQYCFTLLDAVEATDEYLVHRPTLQRLAREYGLELVLWKNFHDFVADRLAAERVEEDRRLWISRGLGGIVDEAGVAEPAACALSADEWEVAHLYAVYCFRKAGEDERPQRRAPERTPVIAYSDVKRIDSSGRVVDL